MATETQTRVMLVDDHEIMRDGLVEVLGHEEGFEVVGQATDGAEAVKVAQEVRPDVILMDVYMPNMDGIEACREIMELLPGTKVLMLTAATETDAVINAVAAGATGYLQKYTGREHLLGVMRTVAIGEYHIPSSLTGQVFAGIRARNQHEANRDTAKLTGGERAILTLFSQGMSYSDIAVVRGNRPLTIRNTIYRIQVKLGVKSKQQLVLWAVRNGLMSDTFSN